ncbi:MAG: ester cyclase [Candidatus Nephthysia bennettiae]|uniref:Ester cyclase n=1 Tax=Candidatus Nephthysia bennettiae TaxID=3127016 RepID=A0A934N4K1_9BACT|nr:ester cyclase [Candidatus Dormibacteraeota bacterium]PZR89119.1 MAG: ester cyclase [Candidatus Dormibacteraeota bacterium]
MRRETNIAAQERFGAAVNNGDLSVLEEVVALHSVDHDPAPVQSPGPQGFRDMFRELRAVFPDLHIEVEHLTATDDDVAFAYTVSGTNRGPLMGHPTTGKAMRIRGMQSGRFLDSKLVERWGSSDQLGVLAQLGLAPRA